jgi:hypothetical protein
MVAKRGLPNMGSPALAAEHGQPLPRINTLGLSSFHRRYWDFLDTTALAVVVRRVSIL